MKAAGLRDVANVRRRRGSRVSRRRSGWAMVDALGRAAPELFLNLPEKPRSGTFPEEPRNVVVHRWKGLAYRTSPQAGSIRYVLPAARARARRTSRPKFPGLSC